MRALYTLALTLKLPLILMQLWWRSVRNKSARPRWAERFGRVVHRPRANGLWIHASSISETQAAAPLVKAFKERYPTVSIIVTSSSAEGSEQVRRLFGVGVYHTYLPFDLPWFWKRFLRTLNPGLLLIMEGEWCPNLLAACQQRGIGVIVANARLNDRARERCERSPDLTYEMAQQLSSVAAKSVEDGREFIRFGLPEDRLEVTGSLKFDVEVPDEAVLNGQMLRQEWGTERLVLALASGHEHEDECLLNLLPSLYRQFPDLLLLLVPHMPERFDAVANAASRRGLSMHRRSRGPAHPRTQVYVVDTMGDMLNVLPAADLVIVGGSLVPYGGHNPIESAALGKATLIGPYHQDVAPMARALERAGALAYVSAEPLVLEQQLLEYLQQPQRCEEMGQAGKQVVDANRGAIKRLVELCALHMKLS